ncbi:MAG TPA: hypothetical protein VJ938_03960 [Acidimicrobiia bacterium]|nr:hypothetical protein [Acidimicrobiia bacterium]
MAWQRRSRLRHRLVVVMAGLLVMLVVATPAMAAEIEVEPSPVSPGEFVTVEGEDFPLLALVTIAMEDTPVTTVLADDDGEFEVSFQIPEDAASGQNTVTATGLLGGFASQQIVVTGSDDTTTTTSTTTIPTTTTTTTIPTTTTTTLPTTTTIPTTTTTTLPTTTTTTIATTTTTPPTTTTGPPTTTATTTTPPSTTTTTTPFPVTPEESTTTTIDPSSTTTTSGPDDTSSTTTTLPAVTTAITLPFTDEGSGFGAGGQADGDAHEIGRSQLTVGHFTIDPGSGPPGSVVEFTLALNQAIPGLDSVELAIAGRALGDPVDVVSGNATVERTVPNLDPGLYDVAVSQDGLTLATAPFEVTALQAAMAGQTPPEVWLAIPLVVVILALAWRTFQDVRSGLPPAQRLGPVSAWRVRRGRRPVG